jgi:hypothetical protein
MSAPSRAGGARIGQAMDVSEQLRSAFLGEVADQIRAWDRHSRGLLETGKEPAEIVHKALTGLAHSILVTIDGGTKVSDDGRVVFLTGNDGHLVSEGLHEYLFEFMDP